MAASDNEVGVRGSVHSNGSMAPWKFTEFDEDTT
jgi:hypothetical protein